MSQKGMLIDIDYCTGCHTCELACQQEHGFDENKFGLVVTTQGPLQISEEKWQYDFNVQFTDWCDMCQERVAKRKKPTCVQHCPAQVLEYGDLADLAKKMTRKKMTLIALD